MSNLKVGDRVRLLPGGHWRGALVGKEFEITKKDDFGLLASNGYYVQNADGSQVSGYPVEKVTTLKIGDRVLLTGDMWPNRLRGLETVLIEVRDATGWFFTEAGVSVREDDMHCDGYKIELVEKERGGIVVTPEEIEAFKKAWKAADDLGLKGSRVEAGLIAVKRLQ